MTKVIDGTATAEYTYKADGLRHSKTVDGEKTTHIWDGSNIVLELNASQAVKNKYVRGINLIKDDTSFFLYNAHGDVVQLTNASGAVTKNYKYDAFGVEINASEGDTNPWRYCGEYFDKETNSYYLRARYYSPRIGRFISQDLWSNIKLDEPLSLNLYLYCWGNPINMYDDTGEWPKWIVNLFLSESEKEKIADLKPAERKLVYKYPLEAKKS